MAPIDDTFRFYEPAESHFIITLPQVVQKTHNSPNLNIFVSDPAFKAEFIDKINKITISGKTGEVLTVQELTVFIYAD